MKNKNFIRKKSINRKSGMVERLSFGGIIADIAIISILVILSFCFIVPIWHVIMSSFSDGKVLAAKSGIVFLPVGEMNLNGYKLVFSDTSIIRGYINTIIYVVGATFFSIVLNVLAGYTLSRNTLFKTPLILFVLITMVFSGGLIPTYMVIRSLGWVGTMWAILIPGCTHAFYMMIMMTAFRQVPKEIVEAANIDGAGHLRLMFKIMLPQVRNIITVVLLFSVVQQWNSWFPASIYLSTARELWPLQLWIKQIVASNQDFLTSTNPDYNRYLIQYAVIAIATMPILIAYPFFQKYLEQGQLIGGVKG